MSQSKPMNGADFVLWASSIAQECSAWAKGSMIAPRYLLATVDRRDAKRFIEAVRSKLDYIDAWSDLNPECDATNDDLDRAEALMHSGGKAVVKRAECDPPPPNRDR